MEGNKNALTLIGIITLIVGLAAGYFVGDARGTAESESALLPIIDFTFPRPPEVMNALTGKMVGAYGASFSLEVADPDDYLPHVDGSPRRMEARTVNVSANTAYTDINYNRYDASGNPLRSVITFPDLTAGDTVVVRSDENIKDADSFEASVVERVRY